MRMWDLPPAHMCRKHLLGEHVEMHMLVGSFRKGTSLKGYLNNGLLDPSKVFQRHEELVAEMKSRGYNHKSPIDRALCDGIAKKYNNYHFTFSSSKNAQDLKSRCEECNKRTGD